MPILSIATKADPGLQFFEASCELNGIKPIIIGMNDPRPMDHKINGMGLKLILMKEFLEKNQSLFNDNEVILMADAFDIFIVEQWPLILEKFKQFNCDILVSAEKNCHPDTKMAPLFDNLAPNKPWRYINTGCLMLSFGNLKKLISYKPFDAKTDDQLWFQQIFFDKDNPFNIKIDYDCELFQTVFDSFGEVYANLQGRWHNKITKTNPLVIHGNAMPVNMLHHIFRATFPLIEREFKF